KKQSGWHADPQQIARILEGRHDDPFAILGLHEVGGEWIARAYIPYAETLEARTLDGKVVGTLALRDAAGFFEGVIAIDRLQPIVYHAANAGGEWDVVDPYS